MKIIKKYNCNTDVVKWLHFLFKQMFHHFWRLSRSSLARSFAQSGDLAPCQTVSCPVSAFSKRNDDLLRRCSAPTSTSIKYASFGNSLRTTYRRHPFPFPADWLTFLLLCTIIRLLKSIRKHGGSLFCTTRIYRDNVPVTAKSTNERQKNARGIWFQESVLTQSATNMTTQLLNHIYIYCIPVVVLLSCGC